MNHAPGASEATAGATAIEDAAGGTVAAAGARLVEEAACGMVATAVDLSEAVEEELTKDAKLLFSDAARGGNITSNT